VSMTWRVLFACPYATGLRGHLLGERAEAAAKQLFREMAPAPAHSIGLTDIQRWLAAQPPLDQARG